MSQRQSDRFRGASRQGASSAPSLDSRTVLKALSKQENDGKLLKVPTRFLTITDNIRRKIEKDDAFKALRQSIKDYGLLQPIVIAQHNGKISIVAGHRRYLAAKDLGLKEIPVVLKIFAEPQERKVSQFIENVVRQDLSPIDYAVALSELKESEKISASKLALFIGQKDRKYVERLCKVADWDERAKNLADNLKLPLTDLMNIAKRSDAVGRRLTEYLKEAAAKKEKASNGSEPKRAGASAMDPKLRQRLGDWFEGERLSTDHVSKFKSVAKIYNGLNKTSRRKLKEFLETNW